MGNCSPAAPVRLRAGEGGRGAGFPGLPGSARLLALCLREMRAWMRSCSWELSYLPATLHACLGAGPLAGDGAGGCPFAAR